MGCCFPKGDRLLKRSDFLAVSDQGHKFTSRNFLVITLQHGGGETRIGITVSRKVGNAVTRNRVKRMVREYFRLNKHLFTGGDFNIIARQGAAQLDTPALRLELNRLMRRIQEHGH